jgi:hypothetical protein
MKITMCVNPNCPYTKNITPNKNCPKCGHQSESIGFRDSANMIKLKNSIKKGEIPPYSEKDIENLSKSDEEIRKEEIENGIFRGYNNKKKNQNAILTLKEKSLQAVTHSSITGRLAEENTILYPNIQAVNVKRHGLGKVVEIQTASENFKFMIFNTTAFVDMLNEKINSAV